MIDIFVIDESQPLFKKSFESKESTYLLLDFLARGREFGCGFLIGSQTLNLADMVLANTGIKTLVGGLALGSDYDIFASSTGLSREQKEFVKQFTNPGMACIRDPRYPFPFLLEVPKIA